MRPSPISLLSASLLSVSLVLPTAAADDAVGISLAPTGVDDLKSEVIRPGIQRVLDPIVDHRLELVRHVAVGPGGRVWAATDDATVFAVGEPGSFDRESIGLASINELDVLGDGTVVVHDDRQIASWDGSTWTRREALADGARGSVRSIVPADGGTYWALLGPDTGPAGPQLARLGTEGDAYFTLADLGLDPEVSAVATSLDRTRDGSIWLGLGGYASPPAVGLLRFDGGSWAPAESLGDGEPLSVWEMRVDAAGALSVILAREGDRTPTLARWDGSTWTATAATDGFATGISIPDRTEWPAPDWLRWAPSAGVIDYAFPGPFTEAWVTETAPGPDGSMWAVLVTRGDAQITDAPKAGLYHIDPAASAASLPDYRTAGRHGLVPILDPHFATAGGGDGNKRAKWAQRLGTDIVAEVFALGDRWYAGLDSVGRAGDRWVRNNSVGTGTSPTAAIRDALRKEQRISFVQQAARSALLEWPSTPPNGND